MVAFGANATDTGNETTSVPLKVEIIPAKTLSATALDFGRIVVPAGVRDIYFNMDNKGKISFVGQDVADAEKYDGKSKAYSLTGEGSRAVVTGATCEQLAAMPTDSIGFADRSDMTGSNNHDNGGTYATVSDLTCETEDGKAYIHGNLYIDSSDGDVNLNYGTLKGSFTVTAVY